MDTGKQRNRKSANKSIKITLTCCTVGPSVYVPVVRTRFLFALSTPEHQRQARQVNRQLRQHDSPVAAAECGMPAFPFASPAFRPGYSARTENRPN